MPACGGLNQRPSEPVGNGVDEMAFGLKDQTTESLPSLGEQRTYWDERWGRQRQPNAYQSRRGDAVLAMLRTLSLDNPTILDFGCGTGWFTERLSRVGRAVGIDLSPAAIAIAQAAYRNVEFIAGNLYEHPFLGGYFDVIVSQEVVPHVEDPDGYLELIARSLKPNGYLVITAANRLVVDRWSDRGPDPHAHIKFYPTPWEFKRMVQRKFRVLRTTSIMPIGDRGFLRLVNSSKVNAVLGAIVSPRFLESLKERAGLGYTLIALAQKRA
jgi:SAM-dependent methyltransferase